MSTPQAICLTRQAPLNEVLHVLNSAPPAGMAGGIVLVTDENGQLEGTITDGDLRRALLRYSSHEGLTAQQLMNPEPIVFPDHFNYRQVLDQLPKELKKRNRRSSKFLGKLIFVDQKQRPTLVIDYHQIWEQKVATHRHIAIVGMGYVGLTLAVVMAEQGFLVSGVDTDPERVRQLNTGHSYVHEVGIDELVREQVGHNLSASTTIPEDADVFIISVSTPVRKVNGTLRPTVDYLEQASRSVGEKLKTGGLVVLRSTVPVGITRNLVLPILEETSGLKAGKGFHLSFAPERTAEGKALQELRSLPQIVGGINEASTESTVALFRELTPSIIRLPDLESAELAKLINNTFRDLIFSYSNYIAQLGAGHNLDVNRIIQAANQGYPRDRVPLPSPGVGGPCLTKDPYIFAEVSRQVFGEQHQSIFEFGRQVNESMHQFVSDSLLRQLRQQGKDPAQTKILICGLAFKGHPETGDVRSSTAIDVYKLLQQHVNQISGHDPVAEAEDLQDLGIRQTSLPEAFEGCDAILFLNNHPSYAKLDMFSVVRQLNDRPIIYDSWGILRSQDILKARPSVYMNLSSVRSSIPNQ